MRKIIIFLLGVTLLIPIVANADNDFDVKFGILNRQGKTAVIREETRIIPFIIGEENLIWGVVIEPIHSNEYTVGMVLYMPAPPKTITDDDGMSYSPERATEGIHFKTLRKKGTSANWFSFDEGDPLGKYSLEVYLNGYLYERFDLEVVENN